MTPNQHRIADLHCHYPMHVLGDRSHEAVDDRRSCGGRWFWLDGLRALVLNTAARIMNHSSWRATWRVDLEGLRKAKAGLVLSVLYDPAFELLVIPAQQRPRRGAFDAIMCQLHCVEQELARLPPGSVPHRVVTTATELDTALGDGHMAFVHCVEGGLYLGTDVEEITQNVATLAGCGVAYVTLAHLWYRGIATNTPAIPKVPDSLYHATFFQRGKGLSALGKFAIRAMYEHRILIDICHMDSAALHDTFELLDLLDRRHRAEPEHYPLIATHAGVRLGEQDYMLDKPTIREIKRRDGVVGLILARYQLNDGVPDTDTSFEAVRSHVEAMYEITGSHRYTCIGSDLDGFIRPPIRGIAQAEHLAGLAAWVRGEYPADVADAILFGNSERVVRLALQRPWLAPA
jgi:microsomal dipeptidase-like Zn-dependent dipeptidase